VDAVGIVNDLELVESRALDWIESSLGFFDPLTHVSPKRTVFVMKGAAEVALLCSLALRDRRRPRYAALAEHIFGIFRNEAVQEHLIRNPASVPSLGFYATLRLCGFEDLRYRSRLEALLRSGYLDATERAPSTELDFIHSRQQAGFPAPDTADVYRRTLTGHHPPLDPLTNDDVYTITHTIFFTTDFGRIDPPFFSDDDRRWFRFALPRLTAFYLRRADWDLSAELLITLAATGTTDVPEFVRGWELLLKVQNEDGSYDGPVDKLKEVNAAPAVEPEWAIFRDNYHTTLAVLLAIVTSPPPRASARG